MSAKSRASFSAQFWPRFGPGVSRPSSRVTARVPVLTRGGNVELRMLDYLFSSRVFQSTPSANFEVSKGGRTARLLVGIAVSPSPRICRMTSGCPNASCGSRGIADRLWNVQRLASRPGSVPYPLCWFRAKRGRDINFRVLNGLSQDLESMMHTASLPGEKCQTQDALPGWSNTDSAQDAGENSAVSSQQRVYTYTSQARGQRTPTNVQDEQRRRHLTGDSRIRMTKVEARAV